MNDMDARKIIVATSRGIYDSFKGAQTIFYLDKEIREQKLVWQSPSRSNVRQKENTPTRQPKKNEESKVMKRILRCAMFNGCAFFLSLFLFECVLLPVSSIVFAFIFGKESFMGQWVWSWLKPILTLVFKTGWIIPLFLLSKIVNALWFQDIAEIAYKHSHGRPVYSQDLSKFIADSVFSMVIQLLFLLQATLVSYIPIYMIGYTLSLVQMCMLYSLYAFEYKWFNMGWELHKRLTFIESNWPYFIGFGLPMAIVTQMSESWIINAATFSILFPIFIISGNEAKPVTDSCDYSLHFFSPVICISNLLFSKTLGNSQQNIPSRISNVR